MVQVDAAHCLAVLRALCAAVGPTGSPIGCLLTEIPVEALPRPELQMRAIQRRVEGGGFETTMGFAECVAELLATVRAAHRHRPEVTSPLLTTPPRVSPTRGMGAGVGRREAAGSVVCPRNAAGFSTSGVCPLGAVRGERSAQTQEADEGRGEGEELGSGSGRVATAKDRHREKEKHRDAKSTLIGAVHNSVHTL